MSSKEKIEIKNRWDLRVMFSCEVDASLSTGARLGAAVLLAVKKSADLRSADLSGADLRSAVLSGADLSGADLRSADLSGADLSGADLSGAVLRSADLRSAYLSGADLSGADLRSANLSGADLSGADLSNLKDALFVGSTYSWNIVAVRHPGGVMIAAGCRWFTMKEALAHWKTRGKERAFMSTTLAYIRAAAKARKWKT